jgi:penicillin-binding protein 1C
MLQQYTPSRFLYRLQQSGITTMNMPAEHYGLSLILGGAEASLWDLAGIYASMGRTLINYNKYHKYDINDFKPLNYFSVYNNSKKELINSAPVLGAGAIYNTFEAMARVSRPDEEKYWHNYSSAQKIAWKTGTSFGFRDAWAIGCTPEYVVAVWVGNANGEGRPGLTGIQAAAPVMFEIFNLLPANGEWFAEPLNDLQNVTVCSKSGFPPNPFCDELKEIKAPITELMLKPCPYHQQIILDKDEK